jgi:hypothetical protein
LAKFRGKNALAVAPHARAPRRRRANAMEARKNESHNVGFHTLSDAMRAERRRRQSHRWRNRPDRLGWPDPTRAPADHAASS